ncbi:TPA: hypothetical protein ACPJ2G_003829 [Vibrio alginolyticus]|uniref:hypothetical protein n=1 Tax=Vibrio alginolyticus TaxID=663 RepID=UPI0006CA7481|nr:hypothetical protein [Vibrio alginolyticus]ELB2908843.1 hypothetical protein [Vibrio alginolyticus]ELE6601619.1 hypothetical protein [Vibrio alginolyticus]KPM93266.1 hypothetical protein AOR10_09075 [Vibrio alginolyticus]MCS0076118.1 hypothetical protein [Vibrio alginolyticus]MCS0222154.1 hypothetical protein [Vibrio alginolyticus]
MHLVCKFIPSSKLSSNELSYVLTPDECIGQLSRLRNSDDILRNLPKELAQKISISAKKTTSALLAAIRIELGKGNWVSLSTVARRSPLTDSQLQSFPRLKSLVDSVPASNESKAFKAGYKQVTDDVALVRSYTHVPSEPSPDQKIVVEFAGQWSSNAACLMLGKTEAQKEKVTVGKADTENKHRSLATFKDLDAEGKTLYIKIPCSDQPQPILLKLAEDLQPVDKETQMDEWDNVLVPVVPVHKSDSGYVSIDRGYIYVVWQSEVWREIQVQNDGRFSDVDLSLYQSTKSSPQRSVDISLYDEDSEAFLSGEAFQLYQDGKKVFEGVLDEYACARVFGLTAEEVEVVVAGWPNEGETYTELLQTELSPFKAGSKTKREPLGVPLPHIWLPYKINGSVQSDVALFYSRTQLNTQQLNELKSGNNEKAVKVNLSDYSSAHNFDASSEPVISLPNLDTQAPSKSDYNIISQNEQGVAAAVVNSPSEGIVITYKSNPQCDQPDDFFQLACVDETWSQKIFLREAEFVDEYCKEVVFSGWLPEVKRVNLTRHCRSHNSDKTVLMSVIYQDIELTELL